MRGPALWVTYALPALVVLLTCGKAQPAPTLCDDDACRCDPFTRLICNCTHDYNEVTLRPDGPYRVPSTASGIVIDGCSRVHFLSDTIRGLIHLRNVEIRNVAHAVINERALAWSPFSRDSELNPGLRITIHNSTVNEVASHAVQGRVDDITITNSRISNLKPFAFSSLSGVKNIDLSNNIFDNIEIQAFKKFSTLNFVLRGGEIGFIPSRFLSDVEVTNLFRVEGVTIEHLSSLAYLVHSPKRVLIESNKIDTMDGDGFHLVSQGPITFRNNTVNTLRKGALFGLSVDLDVLSTFGRQELLLDNNTVTDLMPSSLIFNRSSLTLRVDGLNINVTCSCQLAEQWREVLKEQGGTITCWYELENHFVSFPTYINSRCGVFKQNFWIYVVVGVILVMIAAAIAIFFIVRHENEKKKKLQIVMPDGKTYRETEFHIVVERAELLTTDL
ncbi:PREDICTED: uncharacterized protein LOC106110077 [Papilio polytes]|uniref:uncharacterized protein LOC106110077 n=1 Tax=Papilio polytes TaxID=76194 RepID=UPI000676187A|nr:PREDICTED: uncharacterized protein LOC106110077 [Papilio polytes]XP_013147219.1 PREDICTED: uncharacterized protein LOC106110077 [Papilio polytes]XP_013147220.1 PREDICTED: uncharacterized protein LOC106110077 [Papilio polytes]XP_013147221.1 PREDICTED: uncharacterized protein LOC106110077 [Papilio polytes]XP_013147222.1 PREDICTED: uncharacterized protein LOC106110077 [Papilio polytes]